MDINITNSSIRFGERVLEYETYYLDNESYANLSNAVIIKKIIEQWVEAINELNGTIRELYLPYSFDDEWVECFRVTSNGGRLIFQQLWVRENGWAVDISDLREFIRSPHGIRKMFPGVFGIYDKDEIVSSLSNAQIQEPPTEK